MWLGLFPDGAEQAYIVEKYSGLRGFNFIAFEKNVRFVSNDNTQEDNACFEPSKFKIREATFLTNFLAWFRPSEF